jgi:hypothetical protein
MPGLINSAPDCITHMEGGTKYAQDGADFILQANYKDCAGIMTFGPGSTYGDEGSAADTLYYILTWLGIIVFLAAMVGWVLYENRRLIAAAVGFGGPSTPATGPPPQPGGVGDSR